MNQISFFVIILLFYTTLALIFMTFNMKYTKKYINYISMSHLMGIITTIFVILREVTDKKQSVYFIAVFFFLSANILMYAALINFLKKKIFRWQIYFITVLIIIDLVSLNFTSIISVVIHKIILMIIYLYLGIKICRYKSKIFSVKFLGISVIIFAIIQMGFAFYFLFAIKGHYYIDLIIYILQTLTISCSIILITLEEAKRNFSKHVNFLEKEVENRKKLLDDAHELDKLKTEFIANISHDLRTPINIIFSSIELFEMKISKQTEKNEKNKYYLEIMKRNCYRLIKLINDLIDMSKIEAGFIELNLHNYDIVNLTEDLTLSIVPYAEAKNIEVQFDTEFEEKVIACDSEKIERVLLNLLSNAVKFTKQGGHIKVNLQKKDNNVLISIKDNGIGIEKDKQKIIYNRFTQISKSYEKRHEGSGIGLSLVKSLIEMHNGSINLKSEVNKGSEFTVVLPIKVLDEEVKYNFNLNDMKIKELQIQFSDVDV